MRSDLVTLCVLIVVLPAAGCKSGGGGGEEQRIVDGRALVPPDAQRAMLRASGSELDMGLRLASAELGLAPAPGTASAGSPNRVFSSAASGNRKQLSSSLKESSLIRKFVQASRSAVIDGKKSSVLFSSEDFKQFTSDTLPLLMAGDETGQATAKEEAVPVSGARVAGSRAFDAAMFERIQKYLIVYFKGKFVDRNGRKLSKPEVKENIGNDTITGVFTVVFEAVSDSLFRLPVFFKVGENNQHVCLTASGELPTAVILDENLKVLTGADNDPNIAFTAREAAAIQYLSNLAGDQSKIVSGFVFRLFNNVEVSFVIGADFAVGDNDTLAKLVDTFFEVGSRRTTEVSFAKYFASAQEQDYPDWVEAVMFLIDQTDDEVTKKAIERLTNKQS
jgi:hypothetical protein